MPVISVKDVMHDTVLAERALGEGVFEMEGAYYFDPEWVDMAHLELTDRTYTCPYKGTCYWFDLNAELGTIRDVGWIYTEPRTGYEYLQGKIGFAFGMRPGVMVARR